MPKWHIIIKNICQNYKFNKRLRSALLFQKMKKSPGIPRDFEDSIDYLSFKTSFATDATEATLSMSDGRKIFVD